MFLSPEVTSNHDLRLCSLPGKSRQFRQTAWLFISIMLLLIWLQRYTVLKSISHVYHLHKKTPHLHVLPCLFRGLCDVRARNWEYVDLVRVHGWSHGFKHGLRVA